MTNLNPHWFRDEAGSRKRFYYITQPNLLANGGLSMWLRSASKNEGCLSKCVKLGRIRLESSRTKDTVGDFQCGLSLAGLVIL